VFELFTEHARQVVVFAQNESRGLGDDFIGPEHVLLGILREDGAAARILEARGVALETTRTALRRGRPEAELEPTGQIPFTLAAKESLEAASLEATAAGGRVRAEHVLLGLIQRADGVAAKILAAAGVDRDAVLAALPENPVQTGQPPGPAGPRFEVVVLAGPPAGWPAQLEQHGAGLGRLATIVHADGEHHAVFQRRP
jgi:ATP-dependent Clp protease ATP-binding subunit ClpA